MQGLHLGLSGRSSLNVLGLEGNYEYGVIARRTAWRVFLPAIP